MTPDTPTPPLHELIDFEALATRLRAVVYVDTDEVRARGLYVSPNVVEILGWPGDHAHLVESGWFDMIHPDDRESFLTQQAKSVDEGSSFDFEYRFVRPDGGIVWVHDHGVLVRDTDDNRLYWQGVLLDVTDRVQAERHAREAELRFKTVEAQVPVVLYAVDDTVDAEVLYCSPNALDVIGHPAEEFARGATAFPRFIDERDRDRVWNLWIHAFATKSSFDAEYRMAKRDGTVIWVHDTARQVATEGAVPFWQGVVQDITRVKTARDELQASEARHRAIVENIPAVVYEMGPDDERRTLFVSPQIERLLGYSRQEWLDQPDIWVELLHPDDREEELAAHDLQSFTGDPWSREYRLIAADGRVVWVRDAATLVRASGDRPVVWYGLLTDITFEHETADRLKAAHDELELRVMERTTELAEANELMALEIGERRRAEKELRHAQDHVRRLIEHVPAVVYTWQVHPVDEGDDNHAYTSPKIEELLGFTVEEWNQEIWTERLHPHDRDRAIEAGLRSEATGEPYEVECRYLTKDGRVVWILDRATLLKRSESGRPYVFQGVMVDVTARMEAEIKATEAEARLQAITERGPIVAYRYAAGGRDTVGEHLGSFASRLGHTLGAGSSTEVDQVHPDDMDTVRATLSAHLSSWTGWDLEYRVIGEDGRIHWLHDRGGPVWGEDEQPHVEGVLVEMTESIDTRKEMERTVARLRSVLEHLPGIAWTETLEPSGRSRYDYISPGVEDMFGYTADELTGEADHFFRMVHPDDRARVMAVWLRADEDPDGAWEDRYRVRHRDGSTRWVHARGRRATPLGRTPAVWHGVTLEIEPPRGAVVPEAEAAEGTRG